MKLTWIRENFYTFKLNIDDDPIYNGCIVVVDNRDAELTDVVVTARSGRSGVCVVEWRE